jgi:AcrR family transcriptional regulator
LPLIGHYALFLDLRDRVLFLHRWQQNDLDNGGCRIEKILKTAWKLYKKTDGKLPAVSLIAQKTGLSKGTVYLYFKTKDEIFLQLFMHQLRKWHEYVSDATATANDELHIASLKNLA